MTLQTTLQRLTAQAMRLVGSVLVPGTYVHHALPVYDPQTGTVTAPAPALLDVQVFVSVYRREEVDGTRVLASDRRLGIEQAALAVRPQARDTVELDGRSWEVVMIEQDAASLMWICQGRAAGEGPQP